MYENGKFTEEISEQYYDEQVGEFLADRYIVELAQNVEMMELMVTNAKKKWFYPFSF